MLKINRNLFVVPATIGIISFGVLVSHSPFTTSAMKQVAYADYTRQMIVQISAETVYGARAGLATLGGNLDDDLEADIDRLMRGRTENSIKRGSSRFTTGYSLAIKGEIGPAEIRSLAGAILTYDREAQSMVASHIAFLEDHNTSPEDASVLVARSYAEGSIGMTEDGTPQSEESELSRFTAQSVKLNSSTLLDRMVARTSK
jgi:hypothetical protein